MLDLKDGYYQVKLDTKSSELCTVSTIFGCYKFLRLPFGVANAPEFFQRENEKHFGDINGVVVYFDDILIAGQDEKEHDQILKKVIERARQLKLKFNKDKLQYRVEKVKYLGHVFTKQGMSPDEDRVKSILSLSDPTNKKELQSVLGMVNYLRKFISNMADLTSPLRELLKKDNEFQWLKVHSDAFKRIKETIIKAPVLGSFDPNKKL